MAPGMAAAPPAGLPGGETFCIAPASFVCAPGLDMGMPGHDARRKPRPAADRGAEPKE
ncbi:hypothetical protein AcidC75_02980 [Acidisoma sp. C75]